MEANDHREGSRRGETRRGNPKAEMLRVVHRAEVMGEEGRAQYSDQTMAFLKINVSPIEMRLY